MTSLIGWAGGKHYLADWIISHFPQHETYVEVFGGAAHVLLKKQPSKLEIYNDLSKDLANLFWVAKMHPTELQKEFELMPYSKVLYTRYLELWKEGMAECDEVRCAAVFMYLANASFQGIIGTGYRTSSLYSGGHKAHSLASKVAHITPLSERCREIEMLCHDWRWVLKQYDYPTTLFYLDPPYAGCKVYSHMKNANWTLDDMQELADALQNIKGKAIVSHHETPEIDAMFEGWHKDTKEVPIHMAYSPTNPHKKRKIEALYMNFDPRTATSHPDQTTLMDGFNGRH